MSDLNQMLQTLQPWLQQQAPEQQEEKLRYLLEKALEQGTGSPAWPPLAALQEIQRIASPWDSWQTDFDGVIHTLNTQPSHAISSCLTQVITFCHWITQHHQPLQEAFSQLNPPADSVSRRRNLLGTPCPLNLVKAKLELSRMQNGEILELILDEGQPIENVPRSLVQEGHRIVRRERWGDKVFRIWVFKQKL